MENRQPNGSQCSKIRFSKIQDGGWPPSWISIFGHNFGVDQHFSAKFGRVIKKIGSPRGPSAQKSDFRKSKIADGCHLGFRFWAIISASINIFACFLRSTAASTTCCMRNDPQIGRGQGYVTYFTNLGTSDFITFKRMKLDPSFFSLLDRPWEILHTGRRMTPKGALPSSRVVLLKQWDRYPCFTERISFFYIIFAVLIKCENRNSF